MERAFRSLRHANYRLFIAGQFISVIGTWMQSVAQNWLIHRIEHSPKYLGLLGFVSGVSALLIGPFAGAFADHHDRRKIVLWTQTLHTICAVLLAVLTFTNQIQTVHVLWAAFFMGCVDCFDIPARQAFMTELVGKEDLMNAIAINASIFNMARLIGPAIAGFIVYSTGEAWCFLLNAFSFLAVIGALLYIRVQTKMQPTISVGFIQRTREGFQYLRGHRPAKSLLILVGMAGLTTLPYGVLMPVFADQILGGDSKTLGYLLAAAGAGALIAAISLARRENVQGLSTQVGWATVWLGVTLTLFSFSSIFWISFLLLVPVGYCVMSLLTATNTLIQTMVPNEMRGRMLSFYTVMFMGIPPIGSYFLGHLAEEFGAPTVVAVAGTLCSLGGVVFLQKFAGFKTSSST